MARILIIDDDDDVLRALSEAVAGLGHEVETATDGRQGLRLFESRAFDCVITDLAMPEVDGLAVLRQVKSIRPAAPVLVVTGNSSVDTLAASVNRGVDGYVTKPFQLRELDEQLDRLLTRAAGAAIATATPMSTSERADQLLRHPLTWILLLSAAVLAGMGLTR